MMTPNLNPVKILFRFYSAVHEEETAETLLAEAVNEEFGYFKLNSTPFYIPKIACGDVVWAEHSTIEGILTYRRTVEPSGNSTIHVILTDDVHLIENIRTMFSEMGCKSEKLNQKYFAIDVPANTDYSPIKQKLDELQKKKVISYAESCLSEKHRHKSTR